MTNKIKPLLAALLVACFTPMALAATCDLVPTGVATLEGTQRAQLLEEEDFTALENELTQSLRKAGKGGHTDLHTLREIVELLPFIHQDMGPLRAWVEKRPQSFMAHLVAGTVYSEQSTYARGSKEATKTSRDQFNNMKNLNQVAMEHLQKARALNPQSALPYTGLIQIAAQEGGARASAEQEVQAANRADPKNLAARITAVSYLAPRWGGSFELLDALVKDASGHLPPDQLKYLHYNVVLEKASHFEVIEKKKAEAASLYQEALKMCSNSSTARSGLSRTRN